MRFLLAILFLMVSGTAIAETQRKIEVRGGQIDLTIAGGPLLVSDAVVEAWVRKSAEAVSAYFGRFPSPSLRIVVTGSPGKGIRNGYTDPNHPVTISVDAGSQSTVDDLVKDDWIMVHEMIHTGLPWLPRENSWLHEGVAVYVESVARVQAGHLTQTVVLRDFIRQMPRGNVSEAGFDDSHQWAKIYWGGALFCLLADIEIHRRTSNVMGLQDALRAMNKLGNYGQDGRLDELIAEGDRATGTSVLRDLYSRMARQPINVDLDGIWRALGVVMENDTVRLDDSAPEASIRKSIFTPR